MKGCKIGGVGWGRGGQRFRRVGVVGRRRRVRVQLQRELLQFANVVFRLLQPEREPAVALLEALLVLVHMPRVQGPGDEQARRDEDQHEGENKTRMLASSREPLILHRPLAAALLAMREGKGRLRVRVAAMRKPQPGLQQVHAWLVAIDKNTVLRSAAESCIDPPAPAVSRDASGEGALPSDPTP